MDKSKNHLRAWRKYRGKTLQEVATELNVTRGGISKVEVGLRGLSMDWLSRLAKVYGTDPRNLLESPPINTTGTAPRGRHSDGSNKGVKLHHINQTARNQLRALLSEFEALTLIEEIARIERER